MVDEIAEHKHCQICGVSISTDKDMCSETCENKLELLIKKRKMNLYMFYGVIIVLMALLLAYQLLYGRTG